MNPVLLLSLVAFAGAAEQLAAYTPVYTYYAIPSVPVEEQRYITPTSESYYYKTPSAYYLLPPSTEYQYSRYVNPQTQSATTYSTVTPYYVASTPVVQIQQQPLPSSVRQEAVGYGVTQNQRYLSPVTAINSKTGKF